MASITATDAGTQQATKSNSKALMIAAVVVVALLGLLVIGKTDRTADFSTGNYLNPAAAATQNTSQSGYPAANR